MTMPPPAPPPFYWSARGMAESRAKTAKALTKGIDRASDDFVVKLDAMQRALGIIRQADTELRLLAYYNKPETWEEALMMWEQGLIKVPYSWESQRAYFPKDYEQDWEDFQKLRERAASGEMGALLQAQELAYVSEPIAVAPAEEALGGAASSAGPTPDMASAGETSLAPSASSPAAPPPVSMAGGGTVVAGNQGTGPEDLKGMLERSAKWEAERLGHPDWYDSVYESQAEGLQGFLQGERADIGWYQTLLGRTLAPGGYPIEMP